MAINIWGLFAVGVMIAVNVGIITVVVSTIRLARRLVLAVEKIADKIDDSPKI